MTDLVKIRSLDHSDQNELDQLIKQWRAKRPRNNLRSAFYDMKNSERHLMGKAVPAVIRKRRFVLGWSALAVDKLNRRCNLEGFYDPNYDLDSLGMGDIMRTNRLVSEVSQAGLSSLIHGPAFLVTTQGDVASGEPEVLINGRDAATSTGFWDPRRRSMRSFLSINELDDDGEPSAMTMYLHGRNLIMVKTGKGWVVDERKHAYGLPVDPMRYKPRLDRPMGSSRISRTVMSLQVQAVGSMIRADVNGEAYSLPRYLLLGASESAFQNADGSPKPSWQAAWDAVWSIEDDPDLIEDAPTLARADVKQFHGQSPQPQTEHLRMLAQMFSGETSIPIGELGIIGDANPTSAQALETSRDDLITEAGLTVDNWKPDVNSAALRALTMLHKGDVPDDLDPQSHWRKPVYVSSAQAADAGAKIIDKVPWLAETEVGLEVLGLSPEQARRAVAERTRSNGRSVIERLIARGNTDGSDA